VTKIEKLDWNDLHYFLAAVRARTLAGAARALGVKHSTVGRRLTALERALGAAVMIRGEHGLQLTQLGEKLVPHAEAIERSVAELQYQTISQTARVRVAVPTGLVKPFTPHFAQFRREHPDISLEFLSSSLPADLNKGEAELALRVGPIAGVDPLSDENLVAKEIGDLGWSLYASPIYLARHAAPIDPRDLVGHEVLGFHSRLAAMPGAKWIAEHGAGASIVLVNREIVEMNTAAVAGVGLAVLPCIVADSEPGLKRLTPEILGHNPLSVVYRREVALNRSVSTVIRFVIQALRTHVCAAEGSQHASSDSTRCL
jgi:DNA-binding transcriptional LysR family regulator